MKVKLKQTPKMDKGGPISNKFNQIIPYPSLYNINPFGKISSNTVGTADDPVTSIIQPVDKDIANVEAEKGEMLVKQDLSALYKIGGKKHSKGGTPIIADQGSFIFSDDPDLAFNRGDKDAFNFKKGTSDKKADNTPAKVLAREVNAKDYNNFVSILNDPHTDNISKQTAALMLQKHQEKIGQVALVQEAKKSFKGVLPEFVKGPTEPSYEQEDMMDAKADKMYAAYGGPVDQVPWQGVPYPNPVDPKTKRWMGDYVNTPSGQPLSTWNSMTGFADSAAYAKAVGYTGDPNNVRAIQQHVMKTNPDIVDWFHSPESGYGMPNSGKPDDGKLGVRWDAIAHAINNHGNITTPSMPSAPAYTNPINVRPPTVSPVGPVPKPDIVQDQWQGTHFGMNDIEKLSMAAPFLAAVAQPTQYDMLTQRYTPNTRLDRLDNSQEIANIQQSTSLGQREAAQNLPGRAAGAIGAVSQARGDSAIQSSFNNIRQANTQIGNQESMFNAQNKVQDNNFNLGQIQQVYRNNALSRQRRSEELTNGSMQSLNNGLAIQNHLDAMGSAATAASLPYVTGAKDAQGNPQVTVGSDNRLHQQMGVPIQFNRNRNTVFDPTFGGLDSVGISQSALGMQGAQFNQSLMTQVQDAMSDKSPEGIKRLYTLGLLLDRTNRPNAKDNTPLENIMQALSRAGR